MSIPHKFAYFISELRKIEDDFKYLRKYAELHANEDAILSVGNMQRLQQLNEVIDFLWFHTENCNCHD